jgi:26S proteasome regulatory subunit N5
MFRDTGTDAMAWHRSNVWNVLTEDASLRVDQKMGRLTHSGDRTCESNSQSKRTHLICIFQNIRVVAQYYTRITLARLTSLLDLTPKQTEEILARLVVSGTIWAKIDRPAGVVNFRSKRSAEDVMNDWSSDMQRLLGLVEKTWMGMNAAQAAQSRVKS